MNAEGKLFERLTELNAHTQNINNNIRIFVIKKCLSGFFWWGFYEIQLLYCNNMWNESQFVFDLPE